MIYRAMFLVLGMATTAMAGSPTHQRGEFLQMWDAIVSNGPLDGNSGWFKPAVRRYTWERIKKLDKNRDGRITAVEFGAAADLFKALDRDGDGLITADDLDWSDNSKYARQMGIAQQLLHQGDNNGNKKLSKEEWKSLFDSVAKGKTELSADDLRKLLFPPPQSHGGGGGMPPKQVLLYGLLTGEIGSGASGPKLEAMAPGLHSQEPGRQEDDPPARISRQEAGCADLRELYLRTVSRPVWAPRKATRNLRRPGAVHQRLRSRSPSDRWLANVLQRQGRRRNRAARKPTRSVAKLHPNVVPLCTCRFPSSSTTSMTASATHTAACPIGCI